MLQSSGPISIRDINIELGRAATAPFSFDGAEERTLANIPTGGIGLTDFYGKSNITSIPVAINTNTIVIATASEFAVGQFTVRTNGDITRTDASNYLWVASSDAPSLDASLYRCRLTKTSGNSNEGALFLDQWRNLTEDRQYTIINNVSQTTVNFVGVLRIEEIANSSNFDEVTINMTVENNGEFEPF